MTKQTRAQRIAELLEVEATIGDMGRKPDPNSNKRKAAAELRRLEAENTNMERLMLSTVPDRWKSCTSPVGAVQSYIAELETANAELLDALEKIRAIELQMYGPDWEEINIAKEIAAAAIKKHGGNS